MPPRRSSSSLFQSAEIGMFLTKKKAAGYQNQFPREMAAPFYWMYSGRSETPISLQCFNLDSTQSRGLNSMCLMVSIWESYHMKPLPILFLNYNVSSLKFNPDPSQSGEVAHESTQLKHFSNLENTTPWSHIFHCPKGPPSRF